MTRGIFYLMAILTISCASQSALPLATRTATVTPCIATVETSRGDDGTLNFRSGPGTEFPVDNVLREGEKVQVIMPLTGWSKVRIKRVFPNGLELELDGYVKSRYLVGCE